METKVKAVIVDDEKNSRIVLRELIDNFCKEIEIVGEAASVNEAFKLINEQRPGLVFLDVQMPTGNGFKLLEKYEKVPFDVVFVTSYDQYAINAIKFSALDYILKPVDIKDLQAAAAKALANTKEKSGVSAQTQIVNLLQTVDEGVKEKKIAFHQNDVVKLINISDISHIESDWNYSISYTSTGDKLISSKTLKEFEDYLAVYDFFIRIHKNCIVNINHIAQYSKAEPCVVKMKNGFEFEISRRKKQEVLEKIKQK